MLKEARCKYGTEWIILDFLAANMRLQEKEKGKVERVKILKGILRVKL